MGGLNVQRGTLIWRWNTLLLMPKKSEWNLIVKCREKVRAIQETFSISHWANITEVFPDAEVKMLGKKVHLNLTEGHEKL